MGGPNPSGPKSEELAPVGEPGDELDVGGERNEESRFASESGGEESEPQTSATEFYSQAYSAPESEHFTSSPYVPVDPQLYDYDSYGDSIDPQDERITPRWPWVVGVAAILAAIALVVSVSLLFARTDTQKLATPATAPSSTPPMQDEIVTTTAQPPPPPPVSTAPPPPPTQTVTVTTTAPPPPPPAAEAPPPPPATPAPPASTTVAAPPVAPSTPAGPRQVTYSVTGTKAPFDVITITYIDASGQRRTQRNAYIPWSMTLTPISQSEIGSVEASSLLRLSKLNCSITTSDGTVLSANNNDQPQTSC
ncbi:MAG: MmpS family transport accessory protein [Mycobacterium sp.]|uniref:MmpS family transport accessory protein n=1 Tax=Mycobacterium sp. TaxID=1785 RepID=UPI002630E563|nr:MmpS family transport accessory protein [Mycobacterium sp.]MDI3313761.1 MmpS family transport accessory protein [Mycobacterium sp.]